MRRGIFGRVGIGAGCLVAALVVLSAVPLAGAATVTFSGTVSYEGTYSGDSLFVAVLDTTTEETGIVSIQSYPVGAPPFNQSYSLEFDNADLPPTLLIASLLDVDGGGIDNVTGVDVLGWYAGTAVPTAVSSSTSQTNLDFSLPQAEIRGTVTFAPDQLEASLEVSDDPSCATGGFRPRVDLMNAGTYAIIGVYAGTYCLGGDATTESGSFRICFGDPSCESPTLITLGATEVRTGVDMDFSVVPVDRTTWGSIKSRYR